MGLNDLANRAHRGLDFRDVVGSPVEPSLRPLVPGERRGQKTASLHAREDQRLEG